MKLPLFSLTILLVLSLVRAQLRNTTVDDTDVSITYVGDWSKGANTPLDYPFNTGSSHSLATNTSAFATFRFSGVAVYFLSPKWPYAVNSMLSLDGAPGECVDLQDLTRTDGEQETIQSAPVWGKDGLANTVHSVVVSACPNGQYIVVDAFTYTFLDSASTSNLVPAPTSSATDSSTVQSSSSPTSTGTPPKSQSRTVAIAVGSAFGGVVISAAIVLLFIFYLQRRKQASNPPRRKRDSAGFMGRSPQMTNTVLPPQNDPFKASVPNIQPNPNKSFNPNNQYYNSDTSSLGLYNPSTVAPSVSGRSLYSSVSGRPHLPEL